MALNIASAFRLRNKLKERIKTLTSLPRHADITIHKGETEDTARFDGKTFAETLEEVSRLMAILRGFNIAIDKANGVNKEDLITLETLKAEIAFYDGIVKNIREAKKYDYEYNPSGGRDKVELEPVLDQKAVVARLDALKKQKGDIEERLANSNLATQVDFDPEIIKRLL